MIYLSKVILNLKKNTRSLSLINLNITCRWNSRTCVVLRAAVGNIMPEILIGTFLRWDYITLGVFHKSIYQFGDVNTSNQTIINLFKTHDDVYICLYAVIRCVVCY